jgi:hypothetical protein
MLEEMEADNTLRGKSLDVVDTVWLSSEIGSITPKTIAACSIYVASRFPDVDAKIAQTEIASVADLSTATIESNWETIYEIYTGESIPDGRSLEFERSGTARGSDQDESWRRKVLREEFPEPDKDSNEDGNS